jgi:diaminopropionate ammonia-lyase
MINENSKVLFFGTEGDTDEDMYEQLVGRSSEQVLSGL